MEDQMYELMKSVVGLPRMQSTPKRKNILDPTLQNDELPKKACPEERSASDINIDDKTNVSQTKK